MDEGVAKMDDWMIWVAVAGLAAYVLLTVAVMVTVPVAALTGLL